LACSGELARAQALERWIDRSGPPVLADKCTLLVLVRECLPELALERGWTQAPAAEWRRARRWWQKVLPGCLLERPPVSYFEAPPQGLLRDSWLQAIV
jgi:hypothetical protein